MPSRQTRGIAGRILSLWRFWIPAILGVAVAAGVWHWLAYRRSPQRAAGEFIEAIERRDRGAICALTLDVERRQLGVTPEVIDRVLHEIFYRQAPQVRTIPAGRCAFAQFRADNWYQHRVAWADAATGKSLPSEAGEFCITLDLFRAEEGGWKVSVTRLSSMYVRSITTPPLDDSSKTQQERTQRILQLRAYRRQLLEGWGIRAVYLYPNPALKIVDGRKTALLDTPAYEPLRAYEQ